MLPNFDFLSINDVEKIKKIAQKDNLYLYQIGQMCGIQDKGFWSRIMSSKKPIPEHARNSLTKLFNSKGV